MKVYELLNKARLALQAAPLKKSGHNKFAGYSYFELGDFLPAINNIFANLGLCSHISFASDLATLSVVAIEDNSKVDFTCPVAGAQLKGCHDVQNLGASITYIRRYLYVNALEIVEHDALEPTVGAEKASPKGAITPTKGVMDSLPAEEQEYLQELAMTVVDVLNNDSAAAANEAIKKENLDADQKTALWSLLDSKTRSALKKG